MIRHFLWGRLNLNHKPRDFTDIISIGNSPGWIQSEYGDRVCQINLSKVPQKVYLYYLVDCPLPYWCFCRVSVKFKLSIIRHYCPEIGRQLTNTECYFGK